MTQKRLAKRTPVAEVEGQLDIGPSIVHRDSDLVSVARQAIGQPRTRVMAVVDDAGRLIGVLPVLRVVEEIVSRASPEALMAEVTDLASASRFGREVSARSAQDLMDPPVSLRLDSTVGDAFSAMHEHRYSGLPVVADDGRVTGYVDLLELTLRYLEDYPGAVPNSDVAGGR